MYIGFCIQTLYIYCSVSVVLFYITMSCIIIVLFMGKCIIVKHHFGIIYQYASQIQVIDTHMYDYPIFSPNIHLFIVCIKFSSEKLMFILYLAIEFPPFNELNPSLFFTSSFIYSVI